MIQRPPRQLRFVGAQIDQLSEGRCRARVELADSAQGAYAGTVEGLCWDEDRVRSAAEATATALTQMLGFDTGALRVQGVEITEAFGHRLVMVALDARHGQENRSLMGFCVIDEDPIRAAALAVLNATNRFLNLG